MSETLETSEDQALDANVGALLRASRQRVGEELVDVARMLCIRRPYLEAIEDSRYEDLPGTTYAAGFVRSYAEHLGLDAEEVVRRFKAETSGKQGATRLDFPVPVHESGVPSGALLFVGLLIAVVAYGAWYLSTSEDNPFADVVSPVPEEIEATEQVQATQTQPGPAVPEQVQAQPEPPSDATETMTTQVEQAIEAVEETTPAEEAVVETVEEAAEASLREANTTTEEVAVVVDTGSPSVSEAIEAAVEEVSGQVPDTVSDDTSDTSETATVTDVPAAEAETVEAVQVEETASAVVEQQAEAATEPRPIVEPEPEAVTAVELEPEPQQATVENDDGTVYGQENADARIIVRAVANSYIQVRDEGVGEVLIARLLVQGDSYLVPNRDGLVLLAGNAGGIEILVDGETMPSIGETGVVRRGVVLDVERLREGTAVDQ